MKTGARFGVVISELRQAEAALAKDLEQIRKIMRALKSGGTAAVPRSTTPRAAGRRPISRQTREAMAQAARKRWARWRKEQKKA